MTNELQKLVSTDEHIEKLETLYTAWQDKLPIELSQLIAKEIYTKKAQNAVNWAIAPTFTQLTLTETRRVYCYECDRYYEACVELGGEAQFLSTEHCPYGCEHQDLDLLDVDTDAPFITQLNIFEQ